MNHPPLLEPAVLKSVDCLTGPRVRTALPPPRLSRPSLSPLGSLRERHPGEGPRVRLLFLRRRILFGSALRSGGKALGVTNSAGSEKRRGARRLPIPGKSATGREIVFRCG